MKARTIEQRALIRSHFNPAGDWFVWTANSLSVNPSPNPGNYVNPTGFSRTVLRQRPSFGKYNFSNGFWNEGPRDLPSWTDSLEFTSDSSTYNAAVSNLADSVRGGVDLSIDAFQAKQTQQMFRAVAHFVEYAREFKRSFRRLPAKAIGGKWLEYQYGWKPLLSTVYDTAALLVRSKPEDNLITLHSRASDQGRSQFVHDTGSGPQTITKTESIRYEIGVTLAPKPNRLQDMGRFTSLNPVSITWELVPYSFVVDWFIDVGGFLRSMETALIYRSAFVHGYSTRTVKKVIYADPVRVYHSGNLRCVVTNVATGIQEKTWLTRTPLSSYPLPRFPVLAPQLGSQRLFSAASLLAQFLGRK